MALAKASGPELDDFIKLGMERFSFGKGEGSYDGSLSHLGLSTGHENWVPC